MELCIRSLSHWYVLENNHADFHLGWPGFNVDILHSSHSSNPLDFWGTRTLFSHGRMYGLTDWWQWNMQVVSVLIQTAVSSACRANTLERCAVTRSEVVLPQVTTPLLFSIIFGLVLIRVSFGWGWTCLLHSSHSAWYGKSVLTCYFLSFSNCMVADCHRSG